MNNGRPNYQHDCENCIFLGTYAEDEDHYDLYFCPQLGGLPTVLARYGSLYPAYTSGLNSQTPALQTAQAMATRRGLL